MYEIRLAGGKVFHVGYLTGILGRLTITKAPEFASAADFPDFARAGGKGTWNLRPIDDYAREVTFTTVRLLCRPLTVSERTPGVGFISLNDNGKAVDVDVYLSTTEFSTNAFSVYEDWTRIVEAAKDDPDQDVLLRMNFGAVTTEEIEKFKSGKSLTTTDIDLHVRSHLMPGARND